MEGGTNTELITAAVIAGGFVALVLLLIFAIRRARAARQREIDAAGEDRPLPVAKRQRPALRPEDVVPEEATPAQPEPAEVEQVPPPPPAMPAEPAEAPKAEIRALAHPPAATVTPTVEKPRASEAPAR